MKTSSRGLPGPINHPPRTDGYQAFCVEGKLYYAHRLAWLYATGSWPSGEINHKDMNRSNNRWKNLRDATHQINKENRQSAQANSRTGVLGVSPKPNGKFVAQIGNNGRSKYLGVYTTVEEAHKVFLKAKSELHVGYVPRKQ